MISFDEVLETLGTNWKRFERYYRETSKVD
jgi:hypothetical protein